MKKQKPFNDTPKHFLVWLCNYQQASEEQRKLCDQYDKGEISVYDFIDNIQDINKVFIWWDKIAYTSEVIEEFALYYSDKLQWGLLFANPRTIFSQEFIDENVYRIDWGTFNNNAINEAFIERIGADRVESWVNNIWLHLSQRDDLSLNFIEKHQNNFNWQYLSRGKLSDKFIAKFSEQLRGYIDPKQISQAIKRYRNAKLHQINKISGT